MSKNIPNEGADIMEGEPNGEPQIGLDLGVARLTTLSDGTYIENPRALARSQRKLKVLQKSLSRKRRGSRNHSKTRRRLARAHKRVADIRKNALHKATTALTKNHGRVVIEDLKVANMTKAGKGRRKAGLNRVVRDAAFGEFRRLLKYKGKLYGCEIVAVAPHYTNQRCSACGHVDAGNRLKQSEFCCLACNFAANADENAAINILVAGSCPETQNACGAGGRRRYRLVKTQPAGKQKSA